MKVKSLKGLALRFIIPMAIITYIPFVALNYYVSYDNASAVFSEKAKSASHAAYESEIRAAAMRSAVTVSAIPTIWLISVVIGIL
ncbi:MAG: hypothetical protein LBH93_03485, partial [Chitinispirillales bacterium]|nr:hypothetical protein [Chitinispirillales bacterium]